MSPKVRTYEKVLSPQVSEVQVRLRLILFEDNDLFTSFLVLYAQSRVLAHNFRLVPTYVSTKSRFSFFKPDFKTNVYTIVLLTEWIDYIS